MQDVLSGKAAVRVSESAPERCTAGAHSHTSASTASARRTTSSAASVRLPTTHTNTPSVSMYICTHTHACHSRRRSRSPPPDADLTSPGSLLYRCRIQSRAATLVCTELRCSICVSTDTTASRFNLLSPSPSPPASSVPPSGSGGGGSSDTNLLSWKLTVAAVSRMPEPAR